MEIILLLYFRHKDMEEEKEERNAFVTGNWGCGAFGGHKELKAIEQLIGALLYISLIVMVTHDGL